jgi:small nuclear ribonucleoprotein (snRNP)-like protein
LSALARRKYFEQLSTLMHNLVTVVTVDGKKYVGILEGYNPDTMSVCLSDAKDEKGNVVHRFFLSGSVVSQIYTTEKPFDLKALADRLEKVFPRMVKLYDDISVIVVMDRVRLNETGIIEGSGLVAERVQRVYDEFMRETRPKD